MTMDSPPPARKPSTRERFNALLAEWGPLMLVVYFSIFGLVLVGFATAIELGFSPSGVTGSAGTWVAAYAATQLTKPLRIAATFFITPVLGTLLRRVRRQPAAQEAVATPAAFDESPSGER
jgi:hypothetical protein